jgi:hypothetical protein
MSKKPFIQKKSRPTITKDTRLSDLTINDLSEFFGGSIKPQPEKVRLDIENNFKRIIPDIIKNWKEVALEVEPWDGSTVMNVLDDIRNELSAIRDQLNRRR